MSAQHQIPRAAVRAAVPAANQGSPCGLGWARYFVTSGTRPRNWLRANPGRRFAAAPRRSALGYDVQALRANEVGDWHQRVARWGKMPQPPESQLRAGAPRLTPLRFASPRRACSPCGLGQGPRIITPGTRPRNSWGANPGRRSAADAAALWPGLICFGLSGQVKRRYAAFSTRRVGLRWLGLPAPASQGVRRFLIRAALRAFLDSESRDTVPTRRVGLRWLGLPAPASQGVRRFLIRAALRALLDSESRDTVPTRRVGLRWLGLPAPAQATARHREAWRS